MSDIDVKKIRERLGLTQEEFADLIGVSRNTIANYEKGGKIPASKRAILSKYVGGLTNIVPEETSEVIANRSGNVFELKDGRYRIFVKKVPVKAYGSYLSDFQDPDFYDELEEISFNVDHLGRGNYIAFEVQGESMNGGGINDAPEGAELLCRELGRQHWKDGFRDSQYGWVIVHKDTVLYKDIKYFNKETGDIVCSSRNKLPQYPDFTINLNEVRQIWKVIKRSF